MSEEQLDFRALFEAAPDKYLILSPALNILGASDAYLQATMTTRDAVLGRPLFEVFPDNPDEVDATGVQTLRGSLQRVIRTHTADTMAVQKYDVRKPISEGGAFEVRYWSPVNTPVLSSSGALRYIIHRVEDVTEFVRMKQAADVSASDAIRIEAEIFQRARELQQANEHIRELNAELERRVESGTHDLAAAAARLQQAQKMEAVGQLAGGVAHDFNNMLSVILTYAMIAREELPAGSEAALSCLDQVTHAALRSAELTRKLLAFSRQQVVRPVVLDANEVVSGLQEMLGRLVSELVRIETTLKPGIGTICIDRGHLEQVLTNLVVNARDAMPEGGVVSIETGEVQLAADSLPGYDVMPGPYVSLTVRDEGTGMPPEILARVFEPFFTTKEVGRGTGLGLSMVHGVVTQAHGHITTTSTLGQGTTFTMYFPCLGVRPAQLSHPHEVAVPGGDECILLVEDEPLVRDAAQAALVERGYRVLPASSPRDAIAIAAREGRRIALLLSDVIMPGMRGPDLAAKLRTGNPHLRVLFMSGYTAHELPRLGNTPLLEKPFTPASLARKVREALDT